MAELAVANTVIGLASKIYTCSDVGWTIIQRVNEFVNNTAGDVPEVLIDIKAQLPLLIEKIDQLKSLGENRLQNIDPPGALTEAVTGCQSRLNRLGTLLNKLQPRVEDSLTKKMKKGFQSMFYEGEMSKILIKLESYKTAFMLHFADISIDLEKVAKKDESYYMVPCLQVSDYVERIDLLESVKSAVQRKSRTMLSGLTFLKASNRQCSNAGNSIGSAATQGTAATPSGYSAWNGWPGEVTTSSGILLNCEIVKGLSGHILD